MRFGEFGGEMEVKNISKLKNIYVASLVLILTLTGLSCGKKATPAVTETPTATATTTVTDLSNVEVTTVDTNFATNYAAAKAKAGEWKGDSNLVSLSIKLPSDLSLNNANETFVFGSPSDPDYWFTLTIAESSSRSVRALIPKADYLGNAISTPIAIQYWKSNYLQAFQIADAYAGKTIRTTYPDTQVTITLQHSDPKGWLWWTVEYKNSTATTKVRVNPSTLYIYDETGNIISTGVTATPTTTDTTGSSTGTTSSDTTIPTTTPTSTGLTTQ